MKLRDRPEQVVACDTNILELIVAEAGKLTNGAVATTAGDKAVDEAWHRHFCVSLVANGGLCKPGSRHALERKGYDKSRHKDLPIGTAFA